MVISNTNHVPSVLLQINENQLDTEAPWCLSAKPSFVFIRGLSAVAPAVQGVWIVWSMCSFKV